MSHTIDLGHSHTWHFTRWAPDRLLNPQYDGMPDEDPHGGIIDHLTPAGLLCRGVVTFDTPGARQRDPAGHFWRLVTLEPLTIEPSILCGCGDHGFVRQGKWEPA